jgi:hypothetical protein
MAGYRQRTEALGNGVGILVELLRKKFAIKIDSEVWR